MRGWLILAIFVAMFLGFYLDQRYGRGLRIGLLGGSIFSFFIAVFLGFLSDLTVTEVALTDEGVIRAIYGGAFGASIWRYHDIVRFEFVTRQNPGRPFGFLVLLMKTGIVILGVPDSMSRDELVDGLRCRGVEQAQTPNKSPEPTGSGASDQSRTPVKGSV